MSAMHSFHIHVKVIPRINLLSRINASSRINVLLCTLTWNRKDGGITEMLNSIISVGRERLFIVHATKVFYTLLKISAPNGVPGVFHLYNVFMSSDL